MANPVVHFEIGCRDTQATAAFYGKLFDWKLAEMGPAVMIESGPGGIAGHITALGHEPHNFTHFYVMVDDLQATLDKVAELGGRTLVPPVEIPTGAFAWFADPEGNTVGIFKPK
ncbi:MAG: VOC family protein [Bryobacteraceae bacterium]